MALNIIILAAGQGSRMKSAIPKVLHKLAAKPLLRRVLETAQSLSPDQIIIVYGHGGDAVRAEFSDEMITWVHQDEQLGTGHAVKLALPHVDDDSTLLILYGDVPLITRPTLSALLSVAVNEQLALLTCELENPTGYGRIVRDESNQVIGIVEQKDANAKQLEIREVNTGILAVSADALKSHLAKISNDNAQREYYLTDAIALHVQAGKKVLSQSVTSPAEVEGVNTKSQLCALERIFQRMQAERWMSEGVILADASRVDGRGSIEIGADTFVDVNVVFEGDVKIGRNCIIEANCVIRDSEIGDDSHVKASSVLEGAMLANEVKVGPFARLRPGTKLQAEAQIGNFVEVKNSVFDEASKASHLAYIGDADVGKNVNIGAGTITCNYDGANKHRTVLGDNVFVGSDSQLVAPVEIGANVTIGAGTTVTSNVPADNLVVSRVKQKHVAGWKRPKKK